MSPEAKSRSGGGRSPTRGTPILLHGAERLTLTTSRDVEELRRRFEAIEPTIQAYVPEEGRFQRLHDALARSVSGPLAGVPIGIKDVFRVDGLPTRAGSRVPPEALHGPEAVAVRRLRSAGAVVVGKTHTTEFAYFEPGPTRNPHAPEHTPGGSSSGSAAAVAAGLAALALGTQTIGSVCRPAAFCGVVGFKPTWGRFPSEGLIPLAPSLDHVGTFTVDVAGAMIAAAVLVDHWRSVEPPAEKKPTLAIPLGPYLQKASEVARRHLDSMTGRLRAAGWEVREVPLLGDFSLVADRHQTLMAAEAARVHAVWLRSHRTVYRARTLALLDRGARVDEAALERARGECRDLRERLEATMEKEGIELWLTPAAPGPAPRGLESTGDPVMNLPWTQAGLPAVALPAGTTDEALPLGLQLVGRWERDEELLAVAAALEPILREPG